MSSDNERTYDMHLYDRYFRLLADGRKDLEVRVLYPKLKDLAPGDRIRFAGNTETCLTQVAHVTAYTSFNELLDAEEPARIDPDTSPEQQLVNLRQIYNPEKEALGVLAISVQRLADDSPHGD